MTKDGTVANPVPLSQESVRDSKKLLKVVILATIAGAAIASRLFSVIRFESIIHEFDPWFNFRMYIFRRRFYFLTSFRKYQVFGSERSL